MRGVYSDGVVSGRITDKSDIEERERGGHIYPRITGTLALEEAGGKEFSVKFEAYFDQAEKIRDDYKIGDTLTATKFQKDGIIRIDKIDEKNAINTQLAMVLEAFRSGHIERLNIALDPEHLPEIQKAEGITNSKERNDENEKMFGKI